MERRSIPWLQTGVLLVGALAMAGSLPAQTPDYAQQGPAPVAAQSLAPQQLDTLVAPIALYPDPLLGEVLAASTYPVELVEAHQWLQANGNLSGQQLMDAARQQDWDPSVQALVAMPDAMNLLTQDIRWTTDLGNAFLAQQADVMSAVQRMRQRAQANGRLRSNAQETVTTQYDGGQPAIDIEPANPQVIYVPAYDPYYVYGYGAYPPLYYPDGYWFEPGINVGLFFGGWGGWGYGGGWGWRPDWYGRNVYVNSVFFNRYGYRSGFTGGYGGGRTVWTHDPVHRQGARYPNNQLTSRYGAASQASRITAGRTNNWQSFGNGNVAGRNSFRSSTPNVQGTQRFSNNTQSFQPAPQTRGFQSTPQQRFQQSQQQQRFQSAPQQQQRFQSAPQQQQRFQSAPQQQQRFQPAPQQQQRFQSAPQQQQRFQSAPQQRAVPQQRSAPAYQAPQRSFQSAPRMSAPSAPRMSGGGGQSAGGSAHNNSGGHGGHR